MLLLWGTMYGRSTSLSLSVSVLNYRSSSVLNFVELKAVFSVIQTPPLSTVFSLPVYLKCEVISYFYFYLRVFR